MQPDHPEGVLEEARQALRDSEERYRQLANFVPGIMWTGEADGHIDYASQVWLDYTGFSLDQTLGWGWLDALHPDDVVRVRGIWQQSIGSGEPVALEYRLRARSGPYRWFLARGQSRRDDRGRVQKWFGTLTDIDAQKQLEAALQASETQYRILAEVMPQCIWMADPEGHTDYVNQHWCRYSGLSVESSLGQGWAVVLHPDDRAHLFHDWLKAVETGTMFESEYRMRRVDGEYRWFLGRALPAVSPQGSIERWLGTATDIEDQKRAQQAWRLTAEVGLAVNEAAPFQTCCEIVAASIGVPVVRLWTLNAAASVLQLRASAGLDTRLDGPVAELPLSAADIPVERLLVQVVRTARPITVEVPFQDPRIVDWSWVRGQGTVTFAGHPLCLGPRVLGVVGVYAERGFDADVLGPICRALALGIHRQHTEEDLRRAQADADRANQAKSEFLSRMSHELRTPLNAILGFAQLLEMDPLSDSHRHHVEQILGGGKHLLALIDEVLHLARIEAGQMVLTLEAVSVAAICQEVVDLIRPLTTRRRVTLEAPATDGFVLADRQRLKQVLMNLLSNAVKFSREGSEVALLVARAGPDLKGRLRILVRDRGPGISAANRARLFNPFERLDADRQGVEGTGLGLVVSRRLAKIMGGSLEVESEVGVGSTFWVELAEAAPPDPVASARAEPAGGGTPSRRRTVLAIEDHQDNLALLDGVFAHRPSTALVTARDGATGLALARQLRPDLILLDVHLPDIPGEEVLRSLKNDADLQDVPVLVLSADATPLRMDSLRSAGASEYVTKPITVPSFLALLDRYL